MKKIITASFIYATILFSGCISVQQNPSQDLNQIHNNQIHNNKLYIKSYCSIYDFDGVEVRNYPGIDCLFYDNGDILIGNHSELTMYDRNMRVKWTGKHHIHHSMNKGINDEEILLMSSELVSRDGLKFRSDVFEVLNRNGQVLKTFRLSQHPNIFDDWISHTKKLHLWKVAPKNIPQNWPKWEYSHANSFYQIPKNQLGDRNPTFKEGNYIININKQFKVYVLDKNLNDVLWIYDYLNDDQNNPKGLHDVQMLENGHLRFFVNGDERRPYSTIENYDISKNRRHLVYRANPPSSFFVPIVGFVAQLSESKIIFSDTAPNNKNSLYHKGRARIFDINTGTFTFWPKETLLQSSQRAFIGSEYKPQNLSKFLKNNSGL